MIILFSGKARQVEDDDEVNFALVSSAVLQQTLEVQGGGRERQNRRPPGAAPAPHRGRRGADTDEAEHDTPIGRSGAPTPRPGSATTWHGARRRQLVTRCDTRHET